MHNHCEKDGIQRMETVLLEILETAAIAVSGFLIASVFFLFGKDAATMTALLLIGVNICLGSKNHRLRGVVLMIPFPGIINGLLVPPLLVPPCLFLFDENETLLYQFTVYGVLVLLLFVFYWKGKKWRCCFFPMRCHYRRARTG